MAIAGWYDKKRDRIVIETDEGNAGATHKYLYGTIGLTANLKDLDGERVEFNGSNEYGFIKKVEDNLRKKHQGIERD